MFTVMLVGAALAAPDVVVLGDESGPLVEISQVAVPDWSALEAPDSAVFTCSFVLTASAQQSVISMDRCEGPQSASAEAALAGWQVSWVGGERAQAELELKFVSGVVRPEASLHLDTAYKVLPDWQLPEGAFWVQDAQVKRRGVPKIPQELDGQSVDSTCKMRLMLDARGRVTQVKATRCEAVFLKEATRSARKMRFRPQKVNDVPTESQFQINYKFKRD